MGEQTPSLAAETAALREAFVALNQGDVSVLADLLDPQIEWIEPAHYPGGGTHHGVAAAMAHVSQGRSTWAEGACEPEQFIAAGDKLVMFVHVHVRLKDHTDWIDARLADVYTFRNGKAVHMRHFPDRREALAWAGVAASDAR
jgi:ketosteroid isomerase-like protein